MTEYIMEMFQKKLLRLKIDFSNRTPYLAVTTHYIAWRNPAHQEGLDLKTDLIAFHHFPGIHNGLHIAQNVLYILQRAGIAPSP
ncbi:hypothetical protein H0H92_015416, partial [Tricholoma furcatifolium]